MSEPRVGIETNEQSEPRTKIETKRKSEPYIAIGTLFQNEQKRKAGGKMNKRKRMIVRAKTQMIINADTLEESGWYRHFKGKNGARDKLIGLMVKECNLTYKIKRQKPTERKTKSE